MDDYRLLADRIAAEIADGGCGPANSCRPSARSPAAGASPTRRPGASTGSWPGAD
ncbi:hypothetical protein ACGF0D_04065 [Kitasatospora sp. NPDC048298]|uniref:hypothetical protein n=1 Tax=Kitasatospora sp. NPDC048298 TaxID=3364049 RepID=UPI003724B3C1